MKLSFLDRIYLLGVLPAEGDLTTLRIVRELKSELSFSEQEHADWEIRSDESQIFWNKEKAVDKEVNIGPKAHTIISDALIKMEQNKQLKLEYLDLYEKFVGE